MGTLLVLGNAESTTTALDIGQKQHTTTQSQKRPGKGLGRRNQPRIIFTISELFFSRSAENLRYGAPISESWPHAARRREGPFAFLNWQISNISNAILLTKPYEIKCPACQNTPLVLSVGLTNLLRQVTFLTWCCARGVI